MPLPPTYKFCSIPALIELYTKFGSDPNKTLLSLNVNTHPMLKKSTFHKHSIDSDVLSCAIFPDGYCTIKSLCKSTAVMENLKPEIKASDSLISGFCISNCFKYL